MTANLTLPFALMAGFGVFLFVDALRPRRIRVQLNAPDERPLMHRLLATFFVPAAERVLKVRRADRDVLRADLAVRLKRANYPAPYLTVDAVLGYRVFLALLQSAIGAVAGLLLELGPGTLVIMIGLGLVGWLTPDKAITSAENERVEQLTLDAASTLDRLAIHVSAGSALSMAVREVAEQPGGAWVAELRQLASSYAIRGDFSAAVDEVLDKCGRLPTIVRGLERLKAAAEMGGGGTAKALRQMAHDARETIKIVLTERGYRNTTLMVVPAGLAILAVIFVLLAPGMARLLSQFQM
jgi:pilus assembly protein TadC